MFGVSEESIGLTFSAEVEAKRETREEAGSKQYFSSQKTVTWPTTQAVSHSKVLIETFSDVVNI
jgi:hypothetical protein